MVAARRVRELRLLAIVGAGLCWSCTGSIDALPGDPAGGPGAGGQGPGEAPGAGGVGGMPVGKAGPWALQRLSTREYNNTVRDLLELSSYRGITLPNDAPGISGFLVAGDVTALHAQTFLDTAEELARTAMAAPSKRLLPCSPAGAAAEEACATAFIRDFGKRAFRRPLAADETASLTALYRRARGQGPDDVGYAFRDAIGLLIQRFLISPSFLYHRERTGLPQRQGELLRLGPYEVASRLSYLLWETMPDTTLLAAADDGRLSTAAEVASQVERMLGHPKALPTLTSFHRQWLGMTPTSAADTEFSRFIGFVFKDEARFSTLLTSSVAFATPETAKLYGLPAATIAAMKPGISQVSLDANRRAGLLTQVAFLSANPHPVHRGVAVWQRLFCGTVGKPPKDVPAPPAPAPNLSRRERLAQHGRDPCAGCHRVLDPPGFAFEHYDDTGTYRATDGGKPVDASGDLQLPGGGHVTFKDAVEMVSKLATNEEVQRCFVRQWFRYALGRAEISAEEDAIEAATRQVGATGESPEPKKLDIRKLILAVAGSPAFLLRAPSPGELP